MNKTDLIAKLSEVVGTQKMAKEAVDCILDTITEALVNKETVQIAGFGSFKVGQRQARSGRNPQTGATLKLQPATPRNSFPEKVSKTPLIN